jgi:HAD superfamily hydrolase (TIGR01662 family)
VSGGEVAVAVLDAVDVVVPTVGRPSLAALLRSLGDQRGPLPRCVLLVDDRRGPRPPLSLGDPHPRLAGRVRVLPGPGRGPAAARNTGWRAARAPWIAFLDDDVLLRPDWSLHLAGDLAAAEPSVAGVQGRLRVRLPADRRPTDWERNVAGLESALWATADMAYRRAVLAAIGGFDERFPRAFREDADLGLRVEAAGWSIAQGGRVTEHPVRPAGRWISLRLQAGNADDALMRALHGRGWHRRAGAPVGRRPLHLLTTGAALAGGVAAAAGRRRAALAAGLAAGGLIADFAARRIAPGPRDRAEVATMLATSVAIPPLATAHWLAGLVRAARLAAAPGPAPESPPAAVLLDRDGTLVVDEPYNGDPARVVPVPGVREALDRLRAAGVPLAVVSNQSGVGRGLLTPAQVEAVNRRVEELLGPLGPWLVCPHVEEAGCDCRKPRPGLVRRAAAALGVDPAGCVLIGDIGSDVEAARAAGARGVLVPTAATRSEEVVTAAEVAPSLGAAVDRLLGPPAPRTPAASAVRAERARR